MISAQDALTWASNNLARTAIGLILLAVVAEQLIYIVKRKSLPGPTFTIPFLGGIVHMVLHPFDFWHGQFDFGKLSWNTIFGQFFVVATDSATTRNIFMNCSEKLPLILHPNAYKLLGTNNMAFMNGPFHKELRTRLLPLFSPAALSVYLSIQEKAIHEFIGTWVNEFKNATEPMEMKNRLWELNTYTSMSVFVGPYLTDDLREQLRFHYKAITDGFLAFPLAFPGTTLYKGMQSKKAIIPLLAGIAGRCKANMRKGAEPQCLLDFWMTNTIKEIDECQAKGLPTPPHSTDDEVGNITLDFLFASQDASTASLTWCIDIFTRYPDILAKVRKEQEVVRPNNESINQESLNQMNFTRQVMRELLRKFPPATIVPHIAKESYQINDYSVPRGALVIPSIWSANREGWPNPENFDPDRFSPERAEDKLYDKNFLTFGAGPHACMGQRYAMNHIMCFLAIISTAVEMQRSWTPASEKIIYAPTIYPADHCLLSTFKYRKTAA